MSLKLVKTKSKQCTKCGSTDFKAINGALACGNCFLYIPKELRDIARLRK